MAKVCPRRTKKKPTLIIENVRDSLVLFTINNNNPDRDLTISRIYLRHKSEIKQKGVGWFVERQPRENLGKYVIDRKTENIFLTSDLSTLKINKSSSASFLFTIDLAGENKYLEWNANALLIVEYIGRTELSMLVSDLKNKNIVYFFGYDEKPTTFYKIRVILVGLDNAGRLKLTDGLGNSLMRDYSRPYTLVPEEQNSDTKN